MIEDRIQIDEDIKKLPFIEHYKRMWPFVKPYIFRAILAILIDGAGVSKLCRNLSERLGRHPYQSGFKTPSL